MRARELWYLCVSICVSLVLQGETIDCVIKTFCDKIFGKPAKGRCFPAAPPHAHYRHSLCTPGRPGKLNLHVLIKDGEIFKRTFHLNRPRLERHSCRSISISKTPMVPLWDIWVGECMLRHQGCARNQSVSYISRNLARTEPTIVAV